jgi:retron-type reverse transcriptase
MVQTPDSTDAPGALVLAGGRIARRKQIEQLLEAVPGFHDVFLSIDPYAADYAEQLFRQSEVASSGLWLRLTEALPTTLHPSFVLANAWGAALPSPRRMAAVFRSAISSGNAAVFLDADRLMAACPEAVAALKADQASAALVAAHRAGQQTPPDLGKRTDIMPGMRLRYSLAHHWAQGASIVELLKVAKLQPSANAYLRTRELTRALGANHSGRPRVSPVSEVDFLMLAPELQDLIMATPELRTLALQQALAERPDLPTFLEASRRLRRQTHRALVDIKGLLLERAFAAAVPLIESLPDTEITRRIAVDVLNPDKRLKSGQWDSPEANGQAAAGSENPWVPLPVASITLLATYVDGLSLPAWWPLPGKVVAQRLAEGEWGTAVGADAFDAADLAMIQRSWTASEFALLAAAGRFDVIPLDAPFWNGLGLLELFRAAMVHRQGHKVIAGRLESLADARSVLALLGEPDGAAIKGLACRALKGFTIKGQPGSWGTWIARCIGTPEWHVNASLAGAGARPVSLALTLFKSGQTPIDGAGFRSAVVDLLVRRRLRSERVNGSIRAYLDVDPAAADLVAIRLPKSMLLSVINSQGMTMLLLDRLNLAVADDLKPDIWLRRLMLAGTARSLRNILLERTRSADVIPWHSGWLTINGSSSDRTAALVLAARRDPKRLREVTAGLEAEVFSAALRKAAAYLPATARRDQGFLQLVAALGSHQISYIAAVMSMADRNAAAGHKLDGAYRKHLLPKKSGGSRVISAPHPHLKRIQRAVLDHLIQPLGAHDCAFGFVPGRSIGGNALVHVGQPIVTNADVRNCFPSVKWPLVLGVFRRDLGHQLSPGAVSLLVDICTADGGLPIGAPTSPALLNRVLVRTDEVLHAAAQRLDCRYTRYADDLTFSGDHEAVRLLGLAERVLSQIGLALDPKKTNIYRPGRRQIVTGLVVNERVSVPRRLRRRIRAAVHAVELGRNPMWHGKEETFRSLQGRVAFVQSINPLQAMPLAARLKAVRAVASSPAQQQLGSETGEAKGDERGD